jgi:ribonuclease HI
VSHPDPSNNVAEYSACIHALRWLIVRAPDEVLRTSSGTQGSGLTHEPVEVRSDSQVLIYQLQGLYGVNAPRLIPLHRELRDLAACFRKIAFRRIPREQNAEADALSRKAYEEWIARNPDAFAERYGPYPATEKQRALMERPGIRASPWVSKREASRLIGEALSAGPTCGIWARRTQTNGRVSVPTATGSHGSRVHTVHIPIHLLVRAFGLPESGGRKPMRKKDPGRDPVLRRIVRALRELGPRRSPKDFDGSPDTEPNASSRSAPGRGGTPCPTAISDKRTETLPKDSGMSSPISCGRASAWT